MPEPSPTSDYPIQRFYRQSQSLVGIFQTVVEATRGVFRPGPDDPKTWYGRLLRGVGLLCVWIVIATCIAMAVQEFVSSLRR